MNRMFLGVVLGLSGLGAAAAGTDRHTESHEAKAKVVQAAADDAGLVEDAGSARSVRVRLRDGATVVGTVYAEEAQALVVDCTLGRLSIPRARIASISYDVGAGTHAHAPVQMIDDDDHPTRRASKSAAKANGQARPDE